MTNYDYWYGREVEGRLTDVHSVFIRNKVPQDLLSYPHIYFTWQAPIKLFSDAKVIELIQKCLNIGKAVSIEVNDENIGLIPQELINRCHLLYRLSGKMADKLKMTDTICIDIAPFKVLTATKYTMQHTTPDVYINDSAMPTLPPNSLYPKHENSNS